MGGIFFDIAEALKRIAKGFYWNGFRFESFFVMTNEADITATGFNKSYEDGYISFFWSRLNEAGGAMCADLPALYLKYIDADFTACNNLSLNIEIGVLNPYACNGCMSGDKTLADIVGAHVLSSVLRALSSFAKYNNQFLSEEEAENLGFSKLNGCDSWSWACKVNKGSLKSYTFADNISVTFAELSTGHYCVEGANVDYGDANFVHSATSKCSTC